MVLMRNREKWLFYGRDFAHKCALKKKFVRQNVHSGGGQGFRGFRGFRREAGGSGDFRDMGRTGSSGGEDVTQFQLG